MIVQQRELDLILNPKIHRRMMRLPYRRPCPVRVGKSYGLQTAPGAKARAVITVTAVRGERVGALSASDARREGYAGVAGALSAWATRYQLPAGDERCWVVSFVRDEKHDVARFMAQDEAVFLSRHGDYTLHPHQAIAGEPEVMFPSVEDLKRARAKARERRSGAERWRVREAVGELQTLSQGMRSMKARELLRRAARTVEAADRAIQREGMLDCAVSVAADGSAVEAGPPPRDALVVCLKPLGDPSSVAAPSAGRWVRDGRAAG